MNIILLRRLSNKVAKSHAGYSIANKIPLHSKPGAKSDPSKWGKFLTNGYYTTAEILFTAATLYQLAMFLHFKELSPSASSLYNTGTKSTERIICKMQGRPLKSSLQTPTRPLSICWIRAQGFSSTSMLSSTWPKLELKLDSHPTGGKEPLLFVNAC